MPSDKHGCTQLIEEKASSVKGRPAVCRLLERLRPGNTLMIWKLNRPGRLPKTLVELVTSFQEQQVRFVSLQDYLDPATLQYNLVISMLTLSAKLERDLICE